MAGPDELNPMINPAMAGPTTLARLNWAELRAIALTMAAGGTSEVMKASQVGPLTPIMSPCPSVRTITVARPACRVQASTARRVASSIMIVWVATRIFLRSNRSV
jgi:hypothetical protein